MAKNLLLNVLVDTLGKFVDGLSKDNLQVAVFSGKIEFKNLQLKTSALEDLNLPVTITNGSLKKLTLNIPWTSLESKPVQMEIDGLLLQVEPFNLQKVNTDSLRKSLLEGKHKALTALEEAIIQPYLPPDDVNYNYMQKLAIKIVDNIEVKISNIHVRYEDYCPTTATTYAAGFTLESITICSTDKDWKEKFVSRDMSKGKSDVTHKLGQVKNFTVYWNHDVESWAKLDMDIWEETMMAHIFRGDEYIRELSEQMTEDMHYVILPPSALSVKIAHCEKPQSDKPQIDIDISSSYIVGNVNRVQYHQIMSCANNFEMLEYRKQMVKYRPSAGPLEDPASWWKYSYKMISGKVESTHEKMKTMMLCLHNRDRYIELIKSHRRRKLGIASPGSGDTKQIKETPEQIEELLLSDEHSMITIEVLLPYATLKQYRQVAATELIPELVHHTEHMKAVAAAEKAKRDKGVFSRMFGSKQSSTTDIVANVASRSTEDNEKETEQPKKKKGWFSGWGKGKDKGGKSGKEEEKLSTHPSVHPSPHSLPPQPPLKYAAGDEDDDTMSTVSTESLSSVDAKDVSWENLEKQFVGEIDEVMSKTVANVFICKFSSNFNLCMTLFATTNNKMRGDLLESPIAEASVTITANADIYTEKKHVVLCVDNFFVKDLYSMHYYPSNPNKHLIPPSEYLIAGSTQDSPPKLVVDLTMLVEKNHARVTADPVVVCWNSLCVEQLKKFVKYNVEASAMSGIGGGLELSPEALARLNKLLQADSATIDMAARMLGTSVFLEIEAPKFIIPYNMPVYAENQFSQPVMGYFLVDAGHLLVNGDFGKDGSISTNIKLGQVCAYLGDNSDGMFYPHLYGKWNYPLVKNTSSDIVKHSSVSVDNQYIINPFDVVVIVQDHDKSVADLTVDLSISPEIRASFDAKSIGDLMRVADIIVTSVEKKETYQIDSNRGALTKENKHTESNALLQKKLTEEELRKIEVKFTATLPVLALDVQYAPKFRKGVRTNSAKGLDFLTVFASDISVDVEDRKEDTKLNFEIGEINVLDIHHEQDERIEHKILWTPQNEISKKKPFSIELSKILSISSPAYNGNGLVLDIGFDQMLIELDTHHIERLEPLWVDLSGELEHIQKAKEDGFAFVKKQVVDANSINNSDEENITKRRPGLQRENAFSTSTATYSVPSNTLKVDTHVENIVVPGVLVNLNVHNVVVIFSRVNHSPKAPIAILPSYSISQGY